MLIGCPHRLSGRSAHGTLLTASGLAVPLHPRVTRFFSIRNFRLSRLLLVLFVLLLQGCSLAPEREEIPGEQLETARVAAIDRARYWGDEPQFLIDEEWFQRGCTEFCV